jgi:hypothetical protein
MKKILALVLSLTMILTVASAFAANGSPEKPTPTGSIITPTPAPDPTATPEPTSAPDPTATPEPTNTPGGGGQGGGTVVTEEPKVTIKFLTDTDASKKIIEEFKAALEKGELPDAIKDKVPEGFKNVTEMLTVQFEGEVDKVTKEMILNVFFETQYAKDQKVIVLIGVLTKDPIEWQAFNGVGKEDGSVDVTLPADVFNTLKTDPFLICVISE